MSEVASHRRYLLVKALAAAKDDSALALAWRTQQLATAGTALPITFPHHAKLVAAWYETVEDVRGADASELQKYASLARKDAETVVAAIALIP